MVEVYIDTNVILRFLVKDPVSPQLSERAKDIFADVSAGNLAVITEPVVIAECYNVLERVYQQKKDRIGKLLSAIVSLDYFLVSPKDRLIDALNTSVEMSIDFVDAYLYHAMLASGQTTILSFDKHFRRLKGIRVNEG